MTQRLTAQAELIFEDEHFSLMSIEGMKDRTIMLDGFSKTYAMTGWRLGYGVMRSDLANLFGRLMTNVNSCTASFTQVAGIEALRGDQSTVENMCREFKRRRDRIVERINRIPGFHCRVPKGFCASALPTRWRIWRRLLTAWRAGRRKILCNTLLYPV